MKLKKQLYKILLIPIAALLMEGCKIGKQYTRPQIDLPSTLDSTSVDTVSIGAYPWEQLYTDTILQQLIQKTLNHNKDMLIAAAKVKELAAMKRIDFANLFPQIGARGYAEQEAENYGGNHYSPDDQYDLKLTATWEIDLWGNLRWAKDKSMAEFMGSIENQRALKMSLVAQVAQSYFELVALDNELSIVKKTVDARREEEKDVWELDKLEIEHRENPIKRVRTLNFTRISQDGIRQELKKGIYLNLQGEAIACVQKELTAARRLSRYLADRYPQVQSCRDLNREIIEEYLTYLKTEATGTKHYHADLNRLRSLLESTGQMCDYPNLIGLFLTRDIPPTPKAAFKTYSDAELKRLNREIVKLDAQTARLMIIHQMLGTRISDTLTLTPDCLSERNGEIIIRIRQMKTKPYEKPISAELAALIKKAIAYTKEKYGDTTYIFVDEKNPSRPMPYTTVQFRITDMIYKKELRDDNGEIFGFGTHIYRHYYGMKLTEMHLDDWTIAKLLGHSSVRNVKYYRKMSNQLLADETRKARQRLSAVILDNLDGWEAEYEQIRQDDRLQ